MRSENDSALPCLHVNAGAQVLLRLSESTILCAANASIKGSTDGGRSWARVRGGGIPPHVPAPQWLRQAEPTALHMDIQPIEAYVKGCYPVRSRLRCMLRPDRVLVLLLLPPNRAPRRA